MLSEWDTFCALSVEMEPLRSANDVGVLLQAMRQYPAGLPDRVILIAAELPAYSTQQIALLLARLDTVGIGLVQTSSRLADTGPQVHLLPPPTTCVVCGEPGSHGRPETIWGGEATVLAHGGLRARYSAGHPAL